jgi:hypothetical protein
MVYIVVTAFQGIVTDAKAYLKMADAYTAKLRLQKELGIVRGHEYESPNSVSIHEVEIN